MTEVCLPICWSPPAFTQWTQGAHWVTALSSLNGGNSTEKEDNVYSEDCCYCCSVTKLCPTLHDPIYCSTPAFPICHHLPEFAQVHVHWIGAAIQPSHPLLPASPPALNLSQHQIFSNESPVCIWWPKYWNFSFSISPSNEYLGLISFRIDRFDLAVQRTLKSLLPHHNSKPSVLDLAPCINSH